MVNEKRQHSIQSHDSNPLGIPATHKMVFYFIIVQTFAMILDRRYLREQSQIIVESQTSKAISTKRLSLESYLLRLMLGCSSSRVAAVSLSHPHRHIALGLLK